MLLLLRDYKTKHLNMGSISCYSMKYKLSISVDESTILKIREGMRKGLFRNKSHAFEYAINEVLKENGN